MRSRNTLGIAVCLICSLSWATPATSDRDLVFGGRGIRLLMAVRNGHFSTVAVQNLCTGESMPVRGTEFDLRTADGRRLPDTDFEFLSANEYLLPGSGGRQPGRRLVVRLESRAAVRADLILEGRDGEDWIERYLQLYGPRTIVLDRISLAEWAVSGAAGPSEAGTVVHTLGYSEGAGQPVFVNDLYLAIAHPGAENFVSPGRISLAIPAYSALDPERHVSTERMIIGAAGAGERRRAFIRYIHGVRSTPQRMINLVNDWYWKDKSRPLAALNRLAAMKQRTGVPVDSFTLDDGWSSYMNIRNGVWGALDEDRLPEGWDALRQAAGAAGMNVSLWLGPIGGYGYRARRIPLGRQLGYEIYDDKFCMAGVRYGADAREAFARWARLGMDFIKVDGFWPECREKGHGHPTGAGAAIAQMDSLIETYRVWRQARPDLAIAYTSGSNPSPFWLLHCDYLWRAGADDEHSGVGAPFEKYNTFVDSCLQRHRETSLPFSAFVTFDLIAKRMLPADDEGLKRGFWWAAARTSLHHDWYLHPDDLTDGQWRSLAEAARWAKAHEQEFRFSRMIGGDSSKGEVYGFACFDGKSGTLALRNPDAKTRSLSGTLRQWLELSPAESNAAFRLGPVFGEKIGPDGNRRGSEDLRLELPPFGIAVYVVSLGES